MGQRLSWFTHYSMTQKFCGDTSYYLPVQSHWYRAMSGPYRTDTAAPDPVQTAHWSAATPGPPGSPGCYPWILIQAWTLAAGWWGETPDDPESRRSAGNVALPGAAAETKRTGNRVSMGYK